MSVHKDKKRNTWYFVVRVNGRQRKVRNKNWRYKRQALAAEAEYLKKINSGLLLNEEVTYDDLANRYLNFIKINRKPSTVYNVDRANKNHIEPFFKNKKIKNITLADIEDFQSYILNKTYTKNGKKTHFSNSHLRSIQSIANTIFNYAQNHRIINFNPFAQVDFVQRKEPEVKKEITILTKDEYDKFDAVIDPKKDLTNKSLFSILYWCGLRIGEALGLNIEDYDREKKTLHVYKNYDSHSQSITTTKTGKGRQIDVPDVCANNIEALLDTFKQAEHTKDMPMLGFPLRLSKTTLARHKQEYIDEAKIPYFTFHELRHTHVSTLISLGMRDIDIAKRLGHSVEMVNNTYGHLFPSDRQKLIDKLNKL